MKKIFITIAVLMLMFGVAYSKPFSPTGVPVQDADGNKSSETRLTYVDVDSAYVAASDATPTEEQISHKIVTNYGQSAEVALTLPTPTRHNRCIVCIETASQEFDIIPASGKNFWLDGTELTADYEIEMDGGTSVVGSCISFIALRTAASEAYEWHAFTITGSHVGQAAD